MQSTKRNLLNGSMIELWILCTPTWQLHENEYYLKEKMVEDPIAKVRFPSFAAAATLEHEGKTLYFIDESTLREFQQRTSMAKVESVNWSPGAGQGSFSDTDEKIKCKHNICQKWRQE